MRNDDSVDTGVSPALRVAVVDDDPFMRRTVQRMLKGFRVLCFEGPQPLFDALGRGATFDAIVTDMMMPESTGADLCAGLQERFPQLAERVIIATGGATTPKTAEFLQQTPRPILLKPYSVNELVTLVRKVATQTPNGESQSPRRSRDGRADGPSAD